MLLKLVSFIFLILSTFLSMMRPLPRTYILKICKEVENFFVFNRKATLSSVQYVFSLKDNTHIIDSFELFDSN